MASQGERVPGVDICSSVLDPMAQDKNPVQDIPRKMLQQSLPQMDSEPEMGAAAAAAVFDTLPPHLRQNPSPTPSETATDNGGSVQLSPSVLAQMMEMFRQVMSGDMQQIKNKMDTNTDKMEEMRGEMRQVGRCL